MKQTAALALDLGQAVAMLMKGRNDDGIITVDSQNIEFRIEGGGHALDLDVDQVGFGRGLTAETPKGGGHFSYQEVLNGTGRLPGLEVGGKEALEIGSFFAWEDALLGVHAVGEGVG